MSSITPIGANASGHFDVSDAQFIGGGLAPIVTFGSSAIGNGTSQSVDGGTIFASPLFGLGTLFGTGSLSGPGQPQLISGGSSLHGLITVNAFGGLSGGAGGGQPMACYPGEHWYYDTGLVRYNFINPGLQINASSPYIDNSRGVWQVHPWGGGDMSALAALAPLNATVYGYIVAVEHVCFPGIIYNFGTSPPVQFGCWEDQTLGGNPTVRVGPLAFVDRNATNQPVDVFQGPAGAGVGLQAQPGETAAFYQQNDVHGPAPLLVQFHNPLGYDFYGQPKTAGSLKIVYTFQSVPDDHTAYPLGPVQEQPAGKYYFVYLTVPDVVGGGTAAPTLPPGIKSGSVDGTHLYGNMLAWAENCGGATVPGGSKVQIARVQICRPVLAGQPQISSSVALDTNAKEIIGGAQVIWLDSKALVLIYQQRDTLGGAWNYWWRINPVAGIQETQPPIVNGAIGNWSARQAVNVPTAEWCQISRGQGRIVALYNTGTLTSVQSNAGAGTTTVYTRAAGTLKLIYALDAQCSSWSAPVTVATGVAPCFGGICFTGEEWVVCYTRNSDLASVQRSSGRLDDWSGSTETATGLTRPADTGATASKVPQKPLHCQSLAYDARNILQGLWTTYDDSPATYTPSGGGTAYITYGYYLNVISPDQGRTWKIPYATGRVGGANGDRTLGGMATLVDEVAFIMPQASAGSRGQVTASSSAFYLDAGTLTI